MPQDLSTTSQRANMSATRNSTPSSSNIRFDFDVELGIKFKFGCEFEINFQIEIDFEVEIEIHLEFKLLWRKDTSYANLNNLIS